MDTDVEADWTPPPEIPIVESEVLQIPSGLPSLETFIKAELRKEREAAIAAETEIIVDSTTEPELDTDDPPEDATTASQEIARQEKASVEAENGPESLKPHVPPPVKSTVITKQP